MTPAPVFLSVVSLTADLGVVSSILTLSYTSLEIDHGIVSMVIFLLPLIQEGMCHLQVKVYAQSTG